MPRDPGPPRGLLRPHAPRGRFVHERVAPTDPVVAEHVAHYWWVAWDLRGGAPFTTQTLPHPTAHVVIEARRAVIHGVLTGTFTRRLVGQGRAVGIKFRPAMFQPWLRTSMSALTDAQRPLVKLFGASARELARTVRTGARLADAIVAIEPFLVERAPVASAEHLAVRDLVERMAIDPALTRVEQVAALAGVDVRTLQRWFARFVGVSPKWVIQRYRLHEAAARLTAPDPPTLAQLAASLGYFDQAHFARDFRSVVGAAPSAYLRR